MRGERHMESLRMYFISIEKEMYDQASNQDGGWSDFKPFTVVEKVQESDVITSFYLKPANGDTVPSFLPGQYVTIRIEIQGERYLFNRQYSLSAAPGKDYFRISVKKEKPGTSPDGRVSNYLHESFRWETYRRNGSCWRFHYRHGKTNTSSIS